MTAGNVQRLLTDWGGHSDLHHHLGWWADGVVDIRHEARILTSTKLLARRGEG